MEFTYSPRASKGSLWLVLLPPQSQNMHLFFSIYMQKELVLSISLALLHSKLFTHTSQFRISCYGQILQTVHAMGASIRIRIRVISK